MTKISQNKQISEIHRTPLPGGVGGGLQKYLMIWDWIFGI